MELVQYLRCYARKGHAIKHSRVKRIPFNIREGKEANLECAFSNNIHLSERPVSTEHPRHDKLASNLANSLFLLIGINHYVVSIKLILLTNQLYHILYKAIMKFRELKSLTAQPKNQRGGGGEHISDHMVMKS